jgi:argininosuccinate lyase
MDLNKIHVVMLATQKIMTLPDAAVLLKTLEEVADEGGDAIKWDPTLEDAYFNVEAHITNRIGPAIAGQMHTGRSRNDLLSARTRIFTREKVITISRHLSELRSLLLNMSEQHSETLMTGYTHMQAAQPTTLGHYLHAVAQALERDDVRLQQSYEVVNASPLGACAFNTTGFPIDRNLLADLAGFSGLVENSIDAVASRDYVPQVLATLTSMGITLSRLAQDLYIWSTDEFGFIEVGDDSASTSSIMPQKKNPMTLEHIRAKSAHLIGALVSALTAQKGTPFGHNRDVSLESTHSISDGVDQAEAVMQLASATLRSLIVNKDIAAARTHQNFSTVTEVADVLVREAGLSFREAHGIVGAAVQRILEINGTTGDLTLELLCNISCERLGRQIHLSNKSLQRALDPMQNVMVRSVTGGPAPSEMVRSVKSSKRRHSDQQKWWRAQDEQLRKAQQRLREAVATIIQHGSQSATRRQNAKKSTL